MAIWPTWYTVRFTWVFFFFQSLGIAFSFFSFTFNTQFCQSVKLLLFRPPAAPSLLTLTDTFISLTWSLVNIWLLISSSFKPSLACGEPTSLRSPFASVSHFPIPPAFSWSWKVVVPHDLSWILCHCQPWSVISCFPRPSMLSVCSTPLWTSSPYLSLSFRIIHSNSYLVSPFGCFMNKFKFLNWNLNLP